MKESYSLVHGYKVCDKDWGCRVYGSHKLSGYKKYKCPGSFEENITPICGRQGMHFCKTLLHCFEWKPFTHRQKIVEVIAYGDIDTDGMLCCTNKLMIIRELSWNEVLDRVNFGSKNIGIRSIGERNAGNNCRGFYNTGDSDIGDWNSSDDTVGVFNTQTPTISMFNKPSNWTLQTWYLSDAQCIMSKCPKVAYLDDTMIGDGVSGYRCYQDEYANQPYVKSVRQKWWDALKVFERFTIYNLPNFDPLIFQRCTGIQIDDNEYKEFMYTQKTLKNYERS